MNELDQFVKHQLKVKYYIRYVDDFIIFDKNKCRLKEYREQINQFLRAELKIELHPTKSKIRRIKQGINFLGYRIFPHHKLLRKTNKRKMERKLKKQKQDYDESKILFQTVENSLMGWYGHAKQANTYKYRKVLVNTTVKNYPNEPQIEKVKNILTKKE